MKVKITSPIRYDGKHQPEDTVLDVETPFAKQLVSAGQAVIVQDEAPAEPEPTVISTESVTGKKSK